LITTFLIFSGSLINHTHHKNKKPFDFTPTFRFLKKIKAVPDVEPRLIHELQLIIEEFKKM